jgi:hypothetical protein
MAEHRVHVSAHLDRCQSVMSHAARCGVVSLSVPCLRRLTFTQHLAQYFLFHISIPLALECGSFEILQSLNDRVRGCRSVGTSVQQWHTIAATTKTQYPSVPTRSSSNRNPIGAWLFVCTVNITREAGVRGSKLSTQKPGAHKDIWRYNSTHS